MISHIAIIKLFYKIDLLKGKKHDTHAVIVDYMYSVASDAVS